MVPFHFPGQEHQKPAPENLTAVAAGTHPAPKPTPSETQITNQQQRRIVSLQLAQKQLRDGTSVAALVDAAATLDRFITSGGTATDEEQP